MKTFVLVICLLTVAHAHDCKEQEKVQHLLKEYEAKQPKCECQPKDISLHPWAWFYVLSYMQIIDEKGTINKKKSFDYCLIYEDVVTYECEEMMRGCFEEAETSGSEEKEPEEKTMIAIECVIKAGHGKMLESEKNKCRKRQYD